MLFGREMVGSQVGRVAGAVPHPVIEDFPVKMRIAVLSLLVSAGSVFAQSAPEKKDQPATAPGNATPVSPAIPAKKIEKPIGVQPGEKKKDEKKAEPTLKVGSDAPKLEYTKWIKGTEVKAFEKGKVYVVEFWATWCPPCRESIPHLTELAKKYPGVTIIGMASSERNKDPKDDKRLETLQAFVKDQGDAMNYAVAYDADRKMSASWMRPAGQNGIPCAFIVNGEGKIAWIGNPLNQAFESEIAKVAPAVKDAEKKDDTKEDKKKEKDAVPATTIPAPKEKKDKK
jgi:thiol-disulfide isomerase/thioredoxin